jgi:hypothetical protein
MYIFPDPGFPLNLIFIIFVVILLVSDFRNSGKHGRRKHKKTKTPIVVPKLNDSQRKMLQYIIDEHEGYTVEIWRTCTNKPKIKRILDNLPIGFPVDFKSEFGWPDLYYDGKDLGLLLCEAPECRIRKLIQDKVIPETNPDIDVYFIGCNHDFEYADTTVGCFAGFYKAPGVPHTGPNIIEWAEKNTSW